MGQKCYIVVFGGNVGTLKQLRSDVSARDQNAKHLCQTNVRPADLHEMVSLRKVAAVRCGIVGSHLMW